MESSAGLHAYSWNRTRRYRRLLVLQLRAAPLPAPVHKARTRAAIQAPGAGRVTTPSDSEAVVASVERLLDVGDDIIDVL